MTCIDQYLLTTGSENAHCKMDNNIEFPDMQETKT